MLAPSLELVDLSLDQVDAEDRVRRLTDARQQAETARAQLRLARRCYAEAYARHRDCPAVPVHSTCGEYLADSRELYERRCALAKAIESLGAAELEEDEAWASCQQWIPDLDNEEVPS